MNPLQIPAHITFILFLLAQPALAFTTIDSLPYNCNIPGETYVLATDLSLTSGNAVTISTDDVVIDGSGKTLTYANTGAGYGIYINFSVTRLEIKNVTLIQGEYDPVNGERVHAISRSGDYSGIRIHDNMIRVNHGGKVSNAYGHGVHLANNSANSTGTKVYRNNIAISGTSAGYGISLDYGPSQVYENVITMSGLSSAPAGYGRAISVNGRGSDVYYNKITLDADSDTIQGISLWGVSNTSIHDNTITTAANHARAILIDGNSDNNRIYGNQIKMISRHDSNEDASAGIRVRFGSDNNLIYANTIDASGALNSFPIRLGGEDTRDGQFPTLTPPSNNVIHDNTLRSSSRVISLEDNGSDTSFYRNSVTATGNANAIYLNGIFRSITFSSDRIIGLIRLQDGSSNILFCGTTVKKSAIRIGHGMHNYQITNGRCPYPKREAQPSSIISDTKPLPGD
jgi:hypothetical protein